MKNSKFFHKTVLLNETVAALKLQQGDIVIDCTAGGGGHSQKIWEAISPSGLLLCVDRDPEAVSHLRQLFSDHIQEKKIVIIKSNFARIQQIAEMLNISGKISGIIADLGVSSVQLDRGERGFSFTNDGPLDMRMDPELQLSAKDVIDHSDESFLTQIFRDLGEEPFAKKIAKRIVSERSKAPISTTSQLAELIRNSIPQKKHGKKHPATRVFQALRIYVNSELDELSAFLEQSFSILKKNGHLAIISFHSLEDRLVKNFFKEKALGGNKDPLLKYLPLRANEVSTMREGTIVKPFPILPSEEEISNNIRSRSAKLRVIEKIV